MEMLKLFSEAKANGLSKEEFFHLLDLELKMNDGKKQASSGIMSTGDGQGSGTSNLEQLLRDTSEKIENQQKQQHQMFIETLDRQKQYLHNEFQHFQKQLLQQQEIQLKQHLQMVAQQNELQKCNLKGKGELSQGPEGSLDLALQDMKDKFHEMRNTVLNRLEEEKVFMRDALSKAQHEILSLLSKNGEEVNQIKEKLGADDIARIGEQVSQIQLLCREQNQQRSLPDSQDPNQEGAGSCQVIQDSLKSLLEDLKTKIEDKMEASMSSLKQEVKEMKEDQSAKLPDKPVQLGSLLKDDKSTSYYFCINNFKNCIKTEQSIIDNLMFIDKLQVYVKGEVHFMNNEMVVWLSYVSDSNPQHYVKSSPQLYVKKTAPPGEINVTAVIVDWTGKLPDKHIGEMLFACDTVSSGRPFLIGQVKCKDVLVDGYDLCGSGAVLLKYTFVIYDAY